MSNRQKKFRMERLEDRQMMAGDITASFNTNTGELKITEAAGHLGEANYVHVSTVNGTVHVEGPALIVNGRRVASHDFNGASKVNIELGGGADDVEFLHDVNFNGEVKIDLGAGNDIVDFASDRSTLPLPNVKSVVDINVGAGPYSGSDRDEVIVFGARVQGKMRITTGADNDVVWMENATVHGDGVEINTGAGADDVDVLNCNLDSLAIQTFGLAFENDVDRVNIRGNYDIHIIRNLRAELGGGNDQFNLSGLNVATAHVDAGAGNDTGTLSHVYADILMTRMGAGNDTLDAVNVDANTLSLLGEGGTDSLWTRPRNRLGGGTVASRASTITGWEYVNGVRPLIFNPDDFVPVGTARRPTFGG